MEGAKEQQREREGGRVSKRVSDVVYLSFLTFLSFKLSAKNRTHKQQTVQSVSHSVTLSACLSFSNILCILSCTDSVFITFLLFFFHQIILNHSHTFSNLLNLYPCFYSLLPKSTFRLPFSMFHLLSTLINLHVCSFQITLNHHFLLSCYLSLHLLRFVA